MFATSRAQNEDEAEYHTEQAHRFSALEDCARQMFWAQARDDIGGKAWSSHKVGIRASWMMVAARNPEMPNFARMLGNLGAPD